MSDFQEIHESSMDEDLVVAERVTLARNLAVAGEVALGGDPALEDEPGLEDASHPSGEPEGSALPMAPGNAGEMAEPADDELTGVALAAVYPISGLAEVEQSGDVASERDEPRRRGRGRRAQSAAPPLRRVLEAVLFATDRPVTVEQLRFAVPEADPSELEQELRSMEAAYRETGCGFRLQESGGGYLLQTDPDLHEYVHQFLVGKKRTRLSRAAMETLAIIAYRQPLTRGEMEMIRGVDCGQVLHTLLERDLVAIRGRSQALGRPLLYATTSEFLHYFGISSLADLPSLEELRALVGDDPLADPEIRSALEAEGLMAGDSDPAGETMVLAEVPGISAGDGLSGEEFSGEELSGEELSEDDLSGDELAGEEPDGDELILEEADGEEADLDPQVRSVEFVPVSDLAEGDFLTPALATDRVSGDDFASGGSALPAAL